MFKLARWRDRPVDVIAMLKFTSWLSCLNLSAAKKLFYQDIQPHQLIDIIKSQGDEYLA